MRNKVPLPVKQKALRHEATDLLPRTRMFCTRKQEVNLSFQRGKQGHLLYQTAKWQASPTDREAAAQAGFPHPTTHGNIFTPETQCDASAIAARCIGCHSTLHRHMQRTAFYTSLCCHTRLARMLEDIHPTRLHTLQHRQTRRKRFFQEKKTTLSEEKEGFPKHSKEAFPSIKGDSYNN